MNDFVHVASIDTAKQDFPGDHQSLFLWAIEQKHSVNAEFSGDTRREAFRLRAWAKKYAVQNNLIVPADDTEYGIWYPAEEGEEERALAE